MPVDKFVRLLDHQGNPMFPYTLGSAVVCIDGNGNQKTLQAYINDIESYQGGGTSGSTVTASNVTLTTSAQTFVTVNGISYTIKLPTNNPWENSTVSYSNVSWPSSVSPATIGTITINNTSNPITIGAARGLSEGSITCTSGTVRPYHEIDITGIKSDTINELPGQITLPDKGAAFGQIVKNPESLFLIPIVTVLHNNSKEGTVEAIPCIAVSSDMFTALTEAGVISGSVRIESE